MVKKYVSSAFIGVTVFFALSAGLALVADIEAHQAARIERRWVASNGVFSQQEWLSARTFLETALLLSPGHPDYLQSLGRLYSWRFFLAEAEMLPEHIGGAEDAFRQSLVGRPYWSHAWSELALFRAQARDVDGFWRAYKTSLEVGQWESSSLVRLLNAGLGSWTALSVQQRNELRSLFRRALAFNANSAQGALLVAEGHGLKALLCKDIDMSQLERYIVSRCQRNN